MARRRERKIKLQKRKIEREREREREREKLDPWVRGGKNRSVAIYEVINSLREAAQPERKQQHIFV